MFLRFDAALNGVPLSSIAPEIILRDIIDLAPVTDIVTAPRALGDGERETFRRLNTAGVQLTFVIRARDIKRRTQVMQDVLAWAYAGGILTVNTRPGMQMTVRMDQPPVIGSSLMWTQDIALSLVASEKPYWEAEEPTTVTIIDTGVLRFAGLLPTSAVEADCTNDGAETLTTVTFSCGGTAITLTELAVPPGGAVSIGYTDTGLMTIMADGATALGNRTAESDDDLLADAYADNAISVTADQPVTAAFHVRGRWL